MLILVVIEPFAQHRTNNIEALEYNSSQLNTSSHSGQTHLHTNKIQNVQAVCIRRSAASTFQLSRQVIFVSFSYFCHIFRVLLFRSFVICSDFLWLCVDYSVSFNSVELFSISRKKIKNFNDFHANPPYLFITRNLKQTNKHRQGDRVIVLKLRSRFISLGYMMITKSQSLSFSEPINRMNYGIFCSIKIYCFRWAICFHRDKCELDGKLLI